MTDAAAHGLPRAQLLGVAGAAALVPLNSTMIAVALPRIADDFDISVGRTSLLVTVYLVAMLVGQPLAGRLSDALGHARTIRLALAGFAVASLAAAAAPGFGLLVLARLGQAAFGAALLPSVQSMLRAVTTPAERGRIFGLLGSFLGVGAAGGPVIGGALTGAFGWPAIFLVNVPVVALAWTVSAARTPEADAARPLEDIGSSWRNPVFLAAFAVQALTTLGQYMLLLLAPIVLDARGWSPGSIGLALSSLTLGMIVMGPVGGRAGDRLGRRWPVVAGIGVCVAGLGLGAVAGSAVDVAVLLVVLAAVGFGLGFAVPSLMTAALESVDEARTGAAAGILSMSRYVGSITTSLLVAAWIASDGGGATRALTVSALAAAAALVLAARLPGRVEVA